MLREIDGRKDLIFHNYGFKLVEVMSHSSHWAWEIGNLGYDYSSVPILKDYTYSQFTSLKPSIVITINKDTSMLTLNIENIIFDFAHSVDTYDKLKGITLYDDTQYVMRFNMPTFLDNLCNEIFKFNLLNNYKIDSEKVFSGNCRINFILNNNTQTINGIDSPTLYLDMTDNMMNGNINNMVFKSQDTPVSNDFIKNIDKYSNYYILHALFNMVLHVKLKKKNLKTTYIISPSKYNKINLGGDFDMLRDVYKRDYIAYSEYFGFNDGLSKTDANQFTTLIVNYTYGTSKVLDVKTKINYIWCHLSVINENTLGFIISAELFTESNDYVLPDYIIDGLTEITINIADIYQFSKSGILSIINSDNYDGYKILRLSGKDNNYGYMYATVNTTFYTSTLDGDNSFNTVIIPMNITILDGRIKINADNLQLIKLNYNYIASYHIERIKVYGNINLQFKQPSFAMKYANSLKKTLKFIVLTISNISKIII